MSEEESTIQVTLGGVIDTLEHALELSQEQTPPAESAPAAEAESAPTTHHTAAGESWESIAVHYGVDAAALYEANAHVRPSGYGAEGLPVNKDLIIP